MSRFYNACFEGNLKEVKEYIKLYGMGVIYHEKTKSLSVASKNGHLKLVKYLVSQGARVRDYDSYALAVASGGGYLDVVKYLIDAGAEVTADDNYAVRLACRNDHLEVVKYLVSEGADVTGYRNCCMKNAKSLRMIKYLISVGVDVDAAGGTPLTLVSSYGDINMMKFLLDSGARISLDNGVALHRASQCNRLKAVKFLLGRGSKIDLKFYNPITKACQNGNLDIVKCLIETGVKLSGFVYILCAVIGGSLAVVKYLTNLNIFAPHDYVPGVRNATFYGKLEILKYFISIGAVAFDKLSDLIILASQEGYYEMVNYLVDIGGDVTTCENRAVKLAQENDRNMITRYFKGIVIEDMKKYSLLFLLNAKKVIHKDIFDLFFARISYRKHYEFYQKIVIKIA